MAIGLIYATPEELEARLGRAADDSFWMLLEAASRRVEAYCGRQFNKETAATQRRFRASDPERVRVDDFHTLTGLEVEVDGTVWDSSYYEPRPYDGVHNGEPGWPFFDLLSVNRFWPMSRRPTIYVTAQWGWPAVPMGVAEATLDVAAAMAAGGGASSGIVSRESIDNYSVSYAGAGTGLTVGSRVPSLLAKAEPYRRKRLGAA